ncbi:DUF5615 family PIN-like protein [Acidobacteria bacterium AH-259-O06]|nr:DUF5615 family PIN-like protein [Acidobacteria bacterium AH-259-O06]
MKVLLDESVPRRLKECLEGHEVSTVRDEGWQTKDNGEVLQLASGGFDVFVTADQNLEHQQNLAKYEIGVVVLVASTNRLQDYLPIVPQLLQTLDTVKPGHAVHVAA